MLISALQEHVIWLLIGANIGVLVILTVNLWKLSRL